MAMDNVTVETLVDWLARFDSAVTEQRDYLTELDSAIGDADHGANMARGMTAVMESIGAVHPGTVGELLKTVGMTLVSSVGGASGPLYGTFFLRMGIASGSVTELAAPDLERALRAGLEGVVQRGKAELGDKTMYDTFFPALEAYAAAVAAGSDAGPAIEAAARAAEEGRDATGPMIARKGRASYLGERSIGHLDPGATSAAMLLSTLAIAIAR
ncbi:dihydroxyacetone kinase subunit DhaL [Propionicimonas sp.]|uniref:dihydroxyacetone kinase subunit DhaL n=1 Tax=Propionicimonas sp. TaxID=1955623 RepID=UPI0018413FD6|nr:dihydroxyacetone kinase subunit DhaL [Propionicimonas sp.]MBU3976832.1 dihydroxyacetone kinase subunit L [Actinomycetota bacterium]MBA3019521.1 dihydroxyacetone kinase subunit L [Propionicimonas sp.]MBU3986927.1 dihydroxyacetone kinase subunit L [Actinomycetota bacterium]MBU4006839.1 dihydroxyacetone kinase subunit L [Actinomycetota bacterium]MBU4065539.1 dihydroxyacetone kinase subunit L [Actinomycetota bacterium]